MLSKLRHNTNKELSYKQSFILTFIIIIIGFVLQWFSAGINLTYLRFPVNLILLLFIILLIFIGYFRFPMHRVVVFLTSTKAAISSIVGFSVITLLMGFITQEENPNKFVSSFGLNNIAFSWQYSLMLIYLIFALGFATIKRIFPFRIKNIWYILNHLGLWIALSSANFGFVDQIHLRMKITTDEYKNFAVDESGQFYSLPFEIIQTGVEMPDSKADNIILNINVLNKATSIPASITVNHPININGWNIYFFDLKKNGLKTPNAAIIELIKEPWQSIVYIGLVMMIVGSFFVFWRGKK